MTERRETGRSRRKPSGSRKPRLAPKSRKPDLEKDWSEGERIAKYLARAGVASRREVERMIEEGKVTVDGVKLTSPAFKVTGRELIRVGRKTIHAPDATRLPLRLGRIMRNEHRSPRGHHWLIRHRQRTFRSSL